MKKIIFCLTLLTTVIFIGVNKEDEELTVDQLPGMTTDNVIHSSISL